VLLLVKDNTLVEFQVEVLLLVKDNTLEEFQVVAPSGQGQYSCGISGRGTPSGNSMWNSM
jgi:hypothetical protein